MRRRRDRRLRQERPHPDLRHDDELPDAWVGEDVSLEWVLAAYPAALPGRHRLVFESGRVVLDLVLADIDDALTEQRQLQTRAVDAWFLDGFKPSSNPDMWSETVLQNIGRLTRTGGTLATFTAAGFVRRGLQSAGFAIEKRPGFGRKREMVTGVKT